MPGEHEREDRRPDQARGPEPAEQEQGAQQRADERPRLPGDGEQREDARAGRARGPLVPHR
ncbi:hypothetical protein Q7689_15165, partial [Nocardiopsis tropica]|nr:hypothetical protein [Nocardiopsis tropica]